MSKIITHCLTSARIVPLRTRVNLRAFAFGARRYNDNDAEEVEEGEFRVLKLINKKTRTVKKYQHYDEASPPRFKDMPVDQDWGNVWPGPRVFHPATVPLPLRQGRVKKGQAPPHKWANAELMKIPNFLHLTPPVVKRQCAAIKQFCTEWPKGLDTDEKCDEHYPVEIITSDYCHSGPVLRNPLSRITALRIKLSQLKLNQIATDKFRRLVGERYDEETDMLTITADRCPLKAQNIEYTWYLLTACFYESWKREPWEENRTEDDMEYYDWNRNPSKSAAIRYYLGCNGNYEATDDDVKNVDVETIPKIDTYRTAVSDLHNNGENEEELFKYKTAVMQLFDLPPLRYSSQAQISS